MADSVTIELSDDVAEQLARLKLDDASTKKIKIYQLVKLKAGLQAELDSINTELDGLRK